MNVLKRARAHRRTDAIFKIHDQHEAWRRKARLDTTIPLKRENILHVPIRPKSIHLYLGPPLDPGWEDHPILRGWKVDGFIEPHTRFHILSERHSPELKAREFYDECIKQVRAGNFRVVYEGETRLTGFYHGKISFKYHPKSEEEE